MKPIFILAMVAISAGLIGAGSLNNEIVLTLQDFGVGSADIASPIKAANIGYIIEAQNTGAGGTDQTGELKNMITYCQFQSDEDILGDYTLICKLTTLPSGTVVAEGRVLGADYIAALEGEAPVIVSIPITEFAYDSANAVTNIHDTTLIVMEGHVASTPTEPVEPAI